MQKRIPNKAGLALATIRLWNPQPIHPPKVDPELEHLDPLQRSAESIRYSILSLEFWISKNGQVREWLRHNSRLAAWLVIPALLVLPLLALAAVQVGAIAAVLVGITGNLLLFTLLAFIAWIVIRKVVQILKAFYGIK